jgi:tetratricopeptide (TPR) repeat protein
MKRALAIAVLCTAHAAVAQQPQDPYYPQQQQPQYPPPPQQYPQQPQQQYPQNPQYPSNPQYPQNGQPPQSAPYRSSGGQYPYYPPPQQPSQYPRETPRDSIYPPGQQPQQQYPYYPQQPRQPPYGYAPQRPARLQLTTIAPATAPLVWACVDAVLNKRPEVARAKCSDALARDEGVALAHMLLGEIEPPSSDRGRAELARAAELARRSTPGEHAWVDAVRAWREGRANDAKKAFDQMAQTVPGEPRAFLWRGRFRLERGDFDGAVADFRQAAELDPKFGPTHGLLAVALHQRGVDDEAVTEAKRYVEAGPLEPNANVVLARIQLARGDAPAALGPARAAVAADEKFAGAHQVLGDALLFSGKYGDARKEYARLIANDDAALHHDGAMREARAWVFESRSGDAEKSLTLEADLAQKTRRPGDQVDALVELARLQLDRGAVSDAGQSLRAASEALADATQPGGPSSAGGAASSGGGPSSGSGPSSGGGPSSGSGPSSGGYVSQPGTYAPPASTSLAPVPLDDAERTRLRAELLGVRAMVLAAVGERTLAEARADEMAAALKLAGDTHAGDKATALKGWIAARNRDDRAALAALQLATRPTLRMALALAAARAGDPLRARGIMEELSKRTENDLETALTRPRALAWLKQQQTR